MNPEYRFPFWARCAIDLAVAAGVIAALMSNAETWALPRHLV